MRMTRRRLGELAVIVALAGPPLAITVASLGDTAGDALPGSGTVARHSPIVGRTASPAVHRPAKIFAIARSMPAAAHARVSSATGAGGDPATTGLRVADLTGHASGPAVSGDAEPADDSGFVEINGQVAGNLFLGYTAPPSFSSTDPSRVVAGVNLRDAVSNGAGPTALRGDRLAVSPDRFVDRVPEPHTWALLVAGFGLTGTAVRLRRAQPTAAA